MPSAGASRFLWNAVSRSRFVLRTSDSDAGARRLRMFDSVRGASMFAGFGAASGFVIARGCVLAEAFDDPLLGPTNR